MRDVTIVMDNTPGRPADILDGLAEAGVQIVAGCLYPRLEVGRVAHVTIDPDQVGKLREVVSRLGGSVMDDREVIVVPPEQVGSPDTLARRVADAGASVYVSYFGARGEVVLGTSDLDLTRKALGLEG